MHRPLAAQENVQQSWFDPQLSPTPLHWAAETQLPLHAPEQHSSGWVQLAPSATQVAGTPQTELEQTPVQQSRS